MEAVAEKSLVEGTLVEMNKTIVWNEKKKVQGSISVRIYSGKHDGSW